MIQWSRARLSKDIVPMDKMSTKKRGRAATANKASNLCSRPGYQAEGHHNHKEAKTRKMSNNSTNLTIKKRGRGSNEIKTKIVFRCYPFQE